MDKQPYAIGVDIGGTSTKYGVVNRQGKIVQTGSISTKQYPAAEKLVEALHLALLPFIDKAGKNNFKGIGVGAPNGNYYTGMVDYAPNLPWKKPVPLANVFTEVFDLPCSLTNDANAAAMGEMMYGSARGMKDFIVLTLGTGIGSGIISNGQLVYGHDGFAGELGHIVVRRGRKHWTTGYDGSLETYASATGIAYTAKELLKTSTAASMLRQFKDEEIDAKLVCECARKGDAVAKAVYAFTGEVLGKALANFITFSSPEAIILFGGVIKAGELLLHPTKEHMEKSLLPIYRDKVKLIYSELNEADAAILGASALVWEMKMTLQAVD